MPHLLRLRLGQVAGLQRAVVGPAREAGLSWLRTLTSHQLVLRLLRRLRVEGGRVARDDVVGCGGPPHLRLHGPLIVHFGQVAGSFHLN